MKKTAVIICPGRGTYNKAELGYLAKHHSDKAAVMAKFDATRRSNNQETLTDLDGAAQFSAAKFSRGDNASPLIYASSYFDAVSVSEDYDILAVTGNSMGWYTALAVAGAVTPQAGFQIANTMGTLMHNSLIGGQTIYPFVDENWVKEQGARDHLLALIAEIDARPDHTLAISIHLGGMMVIAGNDTGLHAFEAAVEPKQGHFPMRLANHAAFHTDLQTPVAAKGQELLDVSLFASPNIAMIDGRGCVWYPNSNTAQDLRDYTLGTQVTDAYDFTSAIRVAARTFAPDVFICAGPGSTLGGAIAQSLISANWEGLDSKDAFLAQQTKNPILISMGRADQRGLAITPLAHRIKSIP